MDNQWQLLLKKIVQQKLVNQLDQAKNTSSTNSFVFLDHQLLDMLLIYFIMKSESTVGSSNVDDSAEIIKEMDKIMNEQREAFENIIDALK